MTLTPEDQDKLDTKLLAAMYVAHRDESSLQEIQQLITEGANVNVQDLLGDRPLHICKNLKIAQLLIAKGADVNALDYFNQTPLHSFFINPEVAQLLIAKGADVNAQSIDGKTPLHTCCNLEKAELLIDKGADVNAQSRDGRTPLHTCFINPEVAQLLIAKGADVNAQSRDGKTPLHTCFKREVAQLLIAKGAETIGVRNDNPDINALIQSKATELTNNLTALTELSNDISQLTTQQKAFITHLTAPQKAGNPLEPRQILNNKNLVDYMREDKPNLLQFALEYHEDKIFNGVANLIEFNHSLEVMSLSTIIKNISERSTLRIADKNKLRAVYENAKSNLFLTNGSDFKQQQQQQTASATKIQALGRGRIVRQRNMALARWFTPSPQNKYLPNPCTIL